MIHGRRLITAINIIHIHLKILLHVKLRSASGSGIFSCIIIFDILFIPNLSSLCLNVSIDDAWTTLLGKLLTTRAGNEY